MDSLKKLEEASSVGSFTKVGPHKEAETSASGKDSKGDPGDDQKDQVFAMLPSFRDSLHVHWEILRARKELHFPSRK